ncbi:MAG: 4-hydroxyproline epimerase [Acidobacteriota bacterium]
MERIRFVDSHTEGEPTRILFEGGPSYPGTPPDKMLERLRREEDWLRRAAVTEPRGSDVLVGGLLCEPAGEGAVVGVVFFNNVGYLGMCGHGTIGLLVTLHHLGHVGPGEYGIDTPVGRVQARLHEDGSVSVRNVPSYRLRKNVVLEVPGFGRVCGDVAWGGNWFFLTEDPGIGVRLEKVAELTEFAWRLRRQLVAEGVAGSNGAEIDHVEVFGPPERPDADSKNFVLCPGGAYDRSPCGTGTSAKVACLAADGKLAEGQVWRQEGIVGGLFEASYVSASDGAAVMPTIRGRAYVTAQGELLLDPRDPFRWGIGG